MEAFSRYGKYYLTVIVCFLLFATLAAGISDELVPVGGEGSGSFVLIDPGHGGEDGGAVSVTGVQESGINLDISLRLQALLRLCGFNTGMTRDGDYAIYDAGCDTIARKKASDLRNRVRVLNAQPDAIVLSIHQNHFSEEKYTGAQVFYNHAADSKALAAVMQDTLRDGLDKENRRKSKQAQGVYLMDQIENTAVLIECGFLSNRGEEALLQTEDYQKKIATTICAGLLRFLSRESIV